MDAWISDALRDTPLEQVAAEMGHRRARGRGRFEPCPSCGGEGRGCSIYRAREGHSRWKCHRCGMSGDAIDLVALHLTGDRYQGQQQVADWWRARDPERAPDLPAPQWAAPSTDYPPAAEVARMLGRCRHPAGSVEHWLRSRGVDAGALAGAGVVGELGTSPEAWAVYSGDSWARQGYRAVVPMVDAAGAIRSVRARQVWSGADRPKALPPTGYSASGLMMAGRRERQALAGGALRAVVLVEGEPAWLRWWAMGPGVPTLGIVAGSWSEAWTERLRGARVLVVTDHDEAGDRYAERIMTNCDDAVRWADDKDTVMEASH